MKRLTLAVAAVAALASLAACSSDSDTDGPAAAPASATEDTGDAPTEEAPDETGTETGTDTGTGDDRFAVALTQASDLFAVLQTQGDVNPTSTEEANAAAGLDDTTPLVFADYSVLEDGSGGSLCLLSDTGTYIAVTYVGDLGEVDLGDGECSYDTADALVVGDLATDEWSLGAELMGDLVPTTVFG